MNYQDFLKPKESLKNTNNELNEEISINFTTSEHKVIATLKCSKNETFEKVEKRLYKILPEYGKTNNIFINMGRKIIKIKTIGENNIKDGNSIMLIKSINN